MTRRSIGVVVGRNLACALCCTIASVQPSTASPQPYPDILRSAFNRAKSQKDPAKRLELLDRFPPYLDRKILEHSDKPELVVGLRMVLIRVELERGNPDAAQQVTSQLLSDFRKSAGSPRFERWFWCQLRSARYRDKRLAEILTNTAAGLDIEVPARTDDVRDDSDEDGVPNAKDHCHSFDDRQDSDADGVSDGCDDCWGFPDKQDADEDGVPDGCDYCAGHPDVDSDLDDVPDGCDNCAGYFNPMVPRPDHDRLHDPNCDCSRYPAPACCWQPNKDDDRLGDPCDSVYPQKLMSVQDKSGKVLQSFEYNDFGEVSRCVKWDSERSAMMITTYDYNQFRELVSTTDTPQDGSAPPRKTRLYYDENHRYIGSIKEGDANPGRFIYYDDRKQVIKITAATDPPEKARILERFERDEWGNVLKHEEFNPATGLLEVTSARKYVTNDDGSREIIIRERLDQGSEKMTVEGYAPGEDLPTWIKEYPRPISPPGSVPVDEPLVTRFFYHRETAPNGHVLADGKTTIRPSGVREFEGWRVHGEPYQPGSKKVYERYTTSVDKPADTQKKNWTRRTEAHFAKKNYYYLVEERHADGGLITYQRDPEEPDRVLVEEQRRRSQDGDEIVTRQLFDYSDAGRVTREVTEERGRRLTRTYDYDHQGRVTLASETNEIGTVERHNSFDAFDRSRFRFTVVHHAEFSMVLPNWYLDLERPTGSVIMQAQGIDNGISSWNGEGNSEHVELIVEQHKVSNDASATLDQLSARRLKEVAAGRNWVAAEDGRGEKIRLCGGVEGRLVTTKIKFGPNGKTGSVLQLCLRGKHDSVWLLHMVIRPVSLGRENPPDFPNVDLYQLFLTSFCPDRTAFKISVIEAELSRISQARDNR